jgi:hypothetical protein
MVVLPGMGKSTAFITICQQLQDSGVHPIVFSDHEDTDQAETQM